jgi:hypothetical protein
VNQLHQRQTPIHRNSLILQIFINQNISPLLQAVHFLDEGTPH